MLLFSSNTSLRYGEAQKVGVGMNELSQEQQSWEQPSSGEVASELYSLRLVCHIAGSVEDQMLLRGLV